MDSKFTFNIRVIDETGIWQAIWNSLRDHLNLNFIPLSFKEYNNSKSLFNLNIKFVQNQEFFNFTIYVFKINAVSELKGNIKENIIKNFQSEKDIFPIMLMDIENNDSSLKSCLKVYDKIKSELKISNLKLLPLNTNFLKLSEIVSDFFKEFKNRVSLEINQRFIYFSSNMDSLKNFKQESKDNTFNYINFKDNLLEYLQIAEFSAEVIKICDIDISIDFKHLESIKLSNNGNNSNGSFFNDSISLIDFNEQAIKQKISNKTLTNLDYQLYLFNLILRNYKVMRDFKKLYSFVSKFIGNLNLLKVYFPNIYYFNFWSMNFITKILPFYKTLKSNYLTPYEEEQNIKAQNEILYLVKRSQKNFSKLLNYEIPNSKIFRILAEHYNPEYNAEINSTNLCMNEEKKKQIEKTELEILSFENSLEKKIKNYVNKISSSKNSDENYNNFVRDVNKNLDERSKALISSRDKILEEYLNTINSLEKSHSDLKENKLIFRLNMEKLPILFLLGKFNILKNILLENIRKCKLQNYKSTTIKENNETKDKNGYSEQNYKTNETIHYTENINNNNSTKPFNYSNDIEKWPLLREYMCSLLILLLNSLDKSIENIRIIIEILNVYQSNETISKYFDLKDKNIIKNILTKYLDDNIHLNNTKNNSSNNSNSAHSISFDKENYNSLLKINLNEIINFKYFIREENDSVEVSNDQNQLKRIYFFNTNSTNNIFFDFSIKNKTDLEMKISSINVHFYDEINNKKLKYEYIPVSNNFSTSDNISENNENNFLIIKGSENTDFKFELNLKTLLSIESFTISSLIIDKVNLYLTWGILGIYKFSEFPSIIYLKKNDFEIKSQIFYFKHQHKIIEQKTYEYCKEKFLEQDEKLEKFNEKNNEEETKVLFFNIENPLVMNISNTDDFDFEKYYLDIDLILIDGTLDSEKETLYNKNYVKYSEDKQSIKMEIMNNLNLFYFSREEETKKSYHDLDYFISLPCFKDKEEKIEEEDLLDDEEEKKRFKEKNIKIFNKKNTDFIKNNIIHINSEENFKKYIFSHKDNKKKVNISFIENKKTESILKKEFFLVLNLIFFNSDFYNLYKQNLILSINIRKNNTHESIFFTKEEYLFELKHLFSFNLKSTLRNINLDNKISNLKTENTKEKLTILLQNSISLNLDLDDISVELNNKFTKINQKQTFELINNIPYFYDCLNDLDTTNDMFKFEDLSFNFLIKNKTVDLQNKIRCELDQEFSNQEKNNDKDSLAYCSISSEESIYPKKNIYDIKENKFKIEQQKFFYPLDSIIEKINPLKKLDYIIKIKINNEKNFLKSTNNSINESFALRNRNTSILFNNSKARCSMSQILAMDQNNKETFLSNSHKTENLKKNQKLSLPQNNSERLEVFKEISVTVNIRKLCKKKAYFMIKLKEDNNWTSVGKSRIIENFSIEKEEEKNVILKLIPLQDGHLKLPDIEFSDYSAEFEINDSEIMKKNSVNHLEFNGLFKNSGIFIQGNQKILKIFPILQTGLKVNVI